MNNLKPLIEKKKDVIDHLMGSFGIKTIACRKANVSRTQFYEWINNDTQFAARVNEIDVCFTDLVESNLIEMVRNKDKAATFFYLKAKAKSRGYV